MTQIAAAATEIGLPVEALDTPALYVDLDALEHNIATMAGVCRDLGVAWRPHVKASKAPELAKRLIAGGAVGITCAKVSEAEVMADGGITDILIANEIVGETKIGRLIALAARVRICVAVDDETNLRAISGAATTAGVTVDVLVDINIGANRCGVTPEAAPALARLALDLAGVSLRGLMGYEGHVMGISDLEEKEAKSAAAADVFAEARRRVEAAGITVEVMSGGGTGNYWMATRLGSLNELQAGGGVLMDQTYGDAMKVPGHRQALFLVAQIVSTTVPGRAVGDAGWKASGQHTGRPIVVSPPGVHVRGLNAEHTIFELDPGTVVHAGDRVTMVPHYTDSTILLHRQLFAARAGVVEAVWPIAGAGMLQ
ncbi:MAG: alanine racemase [Chloroflexi bacterium]|nr:alanine racemase [Chloroflexota bacterium]MQC27571.1 DSD1 family PLP-dependent enzyme [Chloroflexota bacterium]